MRELRRRASSQGHSGAGVRLTCERAILMFTYSASNPTTLRLPIADVNNCNKEIEQNGTKSTNRNSFITFFWCVDNVDKSISEINNSSNFNEFCRRWCDDFAIY